jgi:hypothetical protein
MFYDIQFHKIYLLKKTDIINLKSDIFDAAKTFIEVNTISTKINSLWEHFSNMCQELIDVHVPVIATPAYWFACCY